MVRARKTFFKEKGEAETPVMLSHLKIYPGESLMSNTRVLGYSLGCSGEETLSKQLLSICGICLHGDSF